jgi:hypothetical protein
MLIGPGECAECALAGFLSKYRSHIAAVDKDMSSPKGTHGGTGLSWRGGSGSSRARPPLKRDLSGNASISGPVVSPCVPPRASGVLRLTELQGWNYVMSRPEQADGYAHEFPFLQPRLDLAPFRRCLVGGRRPHTCCRNFFSDGIQSGELERRLVAWARPIDYADFQSCAFR